MVDGRPLRTRMGWAIRLLVALIVVLSPASGARAGSSRSGAEAPVAVPSASLTGSSRQAAAGERTRILASLDGLPLSFIENRGQTDGRVAYYLKGGDTTVFFGGDGVTFALEEADLRAYSTAWTEGLEPPLGRYMLKLEFVGAAPVPPQGQEPVGTTVSYFRGRPDEWRTGLPTYHRIAYLDLWPGIDLVYHRGGEGLKYEFVVHPGADPGQIRLAYRGADGLRLRQDGALEVLTPVRLLTDAAPLAYQGEGGERTPVSAVFRLDDAGHTYGFALGDYDPGATLVIDPELVYCGYIGGIRSDHATDVAVDSSGAAYVTGYTNSTESSFPVRVGPDLSHNGDPGDAYTRSDAFVAKVRPDGSGLVYCGYIGGSGDDYGRGIAVDASGAAYVTGDTSSDESTFPVSVGPDLTHNGGADAFVAKVRPDGAGLAYCGYIGGDSQDSGRDIALDSSGAAYVVGDTQTTETSFPVLIGPGLTHRGMQDVFVAKVRHDGVGLLYGGYLGGSGWEEATGVAVDSAGSAYVVGSTDSREDSFPVLVGPDLTHNGGYAPFWMGGEAFVAKVRPDGAGLVYCGYIGGGEWEEARGVAVDAHGAAYVVGSTTSQEDTFPVTVGPDLSYNGGVTYRYGIGGDAFVAKVRPDGTGLAYCGYIGGWSHDEGRGIAVDALGAAYVTGYTNSPEASFPLATGPSTTRGAGMDAFVAKVRPDGAGLAYCGYVGGPGHDQAYGIAIDPAGAAYIVGSTYGSDGGLPVLIGPDLTANGEYDAFVAKVGPGATVVVTKHWAGAAAVAGFEICLSGGGLAEARCLPAPAHGESVTFTDLPSGAYTISETGADESWRVDVADETVTVALGETATTTVTNNKLGRIEVTKRWVGGVASGFEICLSGGDLAAPRCLPAPGHEQSVAFANLAAGTYTVTEVGADDSWQTDTDNAVIALGQGETATATVTNSKLGRIEVMKIWAGGSSPAFHVCLSGGDLVGMWCQEAPAHGQTVAFANLRPGTYHVSETGADETWQVEVVGGSIELGFGETATAAISNTKVGAVQVGRIEVTKFWVGERSPGPTICVAGGELPGPWCQPAPAHGEKVTFPGLVPGRYGISEVGTHGQWSVEISDQTVDLGAGQTAAATIVNTRAEQVATGRIVVTKQWVGGSAGTCHFCLSGGGLSGPMCLPVPADGEAVVFDDLLPGIYSISETGTGQGWRVEIVGETLELGAGETATATVTNTRAEAEPSAFSTHLPLVTH